MTTTEHDLASTAAAAPRRAAAPRAAATASKVAVALALLVVAIGVVALREAALAARWITGPRWLPPVLHAVDGLAPGSWTVPAGILVAAVGVALIAIAVAPRRITARPVEATTAVYLTNSDVRRLANARAIDVGGVLRASTTATKRRITVHCVIIGSESDVRARVADEVARALAPLHTPPRVTVRTRTEKSS